MAPLQQNTVPHALAVPLPFQGHTYPFLDLCLRLLPAGFMVTFANTRRNHDLVTRCLGWSEKPGGVAGLLRFVSLEEEGSIEGGDIFESVIRVMSPAFRGAVAKLLARLRKEEPPVSFLMFDFRLTFVLDLALSAGIPSLSLWTQNAANSAANALYYQDALQLPADDSTHFVCARGVPPLTRKEVTAYSMDRVSYPNFPREEYGRAPFRRVHESTWIVINTFEELESTTLDTLEENLGFRPFSLGPLVKAPPFSISKGADELNNPQLPLNWLQNHLEGSVLYISFGTIVDMSELQLEEIILGLQASGQPFLWVFRANFGTPLESYTIESLTQRFKHQGLLVPWAPQRDVLSHAAIGGFLTHCGWNSIIEAITIGVPMLALPHFADQPLNGRCVREQWNIGLDFELDGSNSDIVCRSEIEKKVRMLMESEKGKELRQNVRRWSVAAIDAYKEGGSSFKHLNNLKEQIWGFHNK